MKAAFVFMAVFFIVGGIGWVLAGVKRHDDTEEDEIS